MNEQNEEMVKVKVATRSKGQLDGNFRIANVSKLLADKKLKQPKGTRGMPWDDCDLFVEGDNSNPGFDIDAKIAEAKAAAVAEYIAAQKLLEKESVSVEADDIKNNEVLEAEKPVSAKSAKPTTLK